MRIIILNADQFLMGSLPVSFQQREKERGVVTPDMKENLDIIFHRVETAVKIWQIFPLDLSDGICEQFQIVSEFP